MLGDPNPRGVVSMSHFSSILQVPFYLSVARDRSALAFVTRKSPVSAALWLVSVMFNLAALYIMMDAHFVGAIQVLVYAGAIMVLFLFVVMLLNLGHPDELSDIRGKWGRLAAGGVGLSRWSPHYVRADRGSCQSAASPTGLRGASGPWGGGDDRATFSPNTCSTVRVTRILLAGRIVGAVSVGTRRPVILKRSRSPRLFPLAPSRAHAPKRISSHVRRADANALNAGSSRFRRFMSSG